MVGRLVGWSAVKLVVLIFTNATPEVFVPIADTNALVDVICQCFQLGWQFDTAEFGHYTS